MIGRDCSGALVAGERQFWGSSLLKICVSLNCPSSTTNSGDAWLWTPPHKPPSRGMGGFGLPLTNRHLGVCRPPPVASLQRRRPAHPLVPVSMECWLASCWRSQLIAPAHLGRHARVALSYFVRSTDGGCAARQHPSEATGGGGRSRQRGGFSTKRVPPSIWRAPKSISPKELESDPN